MTDQHALARQACALADQHDYAGAAQGYDEAADLADQWGDHDHAHELRESAEACRSLDRERLRRGGAV